MDSLRDEIEEALWKGYHEYATQEETANTILAIIDKHRPQLVKVPTVRDAKDLGA